MNVIDVEEEVTGVVLRLRTPPNIGTHKYDAAVTVVGDEGVATLKATMTWPPGSRAAVARTLKRLGFHRVRWTRHTAEGEAKECAFDL